MCYNDIASPLSRVFEVNKGQMVVLPSLPTRGGEVVYSEETANPLGTKNTPESFSAVQPNNDTVQVTVICLASLSGRDGSNP